MIGFTIKEESVAYPKIYMPCYSPRRPRLKVRQVRGTWGTHNSDLPQCTTKQREVHTNSQPRKYGGHEETAPCRKEAIIFSNHPLAPI